MSKIENFAVLTKKQRLARRLPADAHARKATLAATRGTPEFTLSRLASIGVELVLWAVFLYLSWQAASLWVPFFAQKSADLWASMFSRITLDYEHFASFFWPLFLFGVAVAGMVGTFLFVMWIGSKIIDTFCPWLSRFRAQTAKQN